MRILKIMLLDIMHVCWLMLIWLVFFPTLCGLKEKIILLKLRLSMKSLHTIVSIATLLAILLITVKKNLVNKEALEKIVSKSDPVKKLKHDFVPKINVGQVQGGKKPMTFEDPLNMIRSKDATSSVFVGYLYWLYCC